MQPRWRRRTLAMLVLAVAALGAALGITMAYADGASAKPRVKAKIKHGALTVKGTRADDQLVFSPTLTTLEIDVDGSHFSFDRAQFDQLIVRAKRGRDSVRFVDTQETALTDKEITINGGPGGDDLGGGSGVETFITGPGDDTVDGNRGNDVAFLGSGDDTFIWDPGDGNDTLEGQAGTDTMLFNGAGASETVDLSANGERLRFFRTLGGGVGNVLMDTNDLERVVFNALGGADAITVNDLSATDVTEVNLQLGAGDNSQDQVIVNGTAGDDSIAVAGDASGVSVTGLAATVNIFQAEANDQLNINGLAGNDTLDSSGLAPGTIQLLFTQ
jgi:RTX calcium-binding nonapeptide repeat (4 copies)